MRGAIEARLRTVDAQPARRAKAIILASGRDDPAPGAITPGIAERINELQQGGWNPIE